MKVLVVCFLNEQMGTISYHEGWVANFPLHNSFDCSILDLNGSHARNIICHKLLSSRKEYDAVIILHSVYANSYRLNRYWENHIVSVDAPKVYFMANEYKQVQEKLALANRLNSSMLVSQTSNPLVLNKYSEKSNARVISLPHAGLDHAVFYPTCAMDVRPIDMGYIAASEPFYFGHQERFLISDYFLRNACRLGLKVDISYGDNSRRLNRKGYADFLNRCKGQIGTEAGTDFFEIDGSFRQEVIDYVESHPGWTMDDLNRIFFEKKERLPCRMISGRILEAAGTKTVQVLFSGDYNGYFVPDVHYIELKRDFSNIEEVIRKFRDRNESERIADAAYELVHGELTYSRLLDRLYCEISALLQ